PRVPGKDQKVAVEPGRFFARGGQVRDEAGQILRRGQSRRAVMEDFSDRPGPPVVLSSVVQIEAGHEPVWPKAEKRGFARSKGGLRPQRRRAGRPLLPRLGMESNENVEKSAHRTIKIHSTEEL